MVLLRLLPQSPPSPRISRPAIFAFMQSIHPLFGTAAQSPVHSPPQPIPTDTCVRKVALDAELAVWVDSEAARMGMSFGSFVSTLLEWARTEDVASDGDLGLFMAPERSVWQDRP